MKYLKLFPVYLLAIIYLVFGSNYFFHFISTPPMAGNAGVYVGLIYSTGYLAFVKVLEILFALLLIVKPTRALGLLLIAPITVNILLFEIFIAHQPGIGVLLVLINAWAIYSARDKYFGIIATAK